MVSRPWRGVWVGVRCKPSQAGELTGGVDNAKTSFGDGESNAMSVYGAGRNERPPRPRERCVPHALDCGLRTLRRLTLLQSPSIIHVLLKATEHPITLPLPPLALAMRQDLAHRGIKV